MVPLTSSSMSLDLKLGDMLVLLLGFSSRSLSFHSLSLSLSLLFTIFFLLKVSSLPLGVSVEIDFIFEVTE